MAAIGKAFTEGYEKLSQWLDVFRDKCPILEILVIGETGVGKSTLINNLLGEDVAKEGHTVTSATSVINCHEGVIEGVPVKLFDTPGLGDSRSDRDDEYLKMIEKLLINEDIHIIIYCFKMSETRMRRGLIETFKKYATIRIDWKKTMICLTFADGVIPPAKLKKQSGFDMGKYFEEKVAQWKEEIPRVLAEEIGCDVMEVKEIKIHPTTGDHEELLPNGEEWYIPFWLDILKVLPAPALVKFLDIHKENIKYSEQEASRDAPQIASDASPPLPVVSEQSSTIENALPDKVSGLNLEPKEEKSINVSISNQAPVSVNPSMSITNRTSDSGFAKPTILLEGERREDFETTVGTTLEKAWTTAGGMTVGGIAGAAVTTVAAATVATVSAPVIAVGAAVGALGAGVAKIFGWW